MAKAKQRKSWTGIVITSIEPAPNKSVKQIPSNTPAIPPPFPGDGKGG